MRVETASEAREAAALEVREDVREIHGVHAAAHATEAHLLVIVAHVVS